MYSKLLTLCETVHGFHTPDEAGIIIQGIHREFCAMRGWRRGSVSSISIPLIVRRHRLEVWTVHRELCLVYQRNNMCIYEVIRTALAVQKPLNLRQHALVLKSRFAPPPSIAFFPVTTHYLQLVQLPHPAIVKLSPSCQISRGRTRSTTSRPTFVPSHSHARGLRKAFKRRMMPVSY